MIAESTPIIAEMNTGTSQFAADGGVALTSSKTSPGAAKIFSNRPASDVVGAGVPRGGGAGMDGTGSTDLVCFIRYLGKIRSKLQEKSAIFLIEQHYPEGFSLLVGPCRASLNRGIENATIAARLLMISLSIVFIAAVVSRLKSRPGNNERTDVRCYKTIS